VQIAEEAFLPAGEREVGHRRGHADVDADVADLGFVAELARRGAAAREQARLVAVGAWLTSAIASSTVSTCIRLSTGPNTSVRASSLAGSTSASTVGRTKLPLS
jgi:hypothetical protein